MKAKRDNIISELITLRITKAKAKGNSEGGSNDIHLKLAVMHKILIGIKKLNNAKAKAKKNVGELISL